MRFTPASQAAIRGIARIMTMRTMGRNRAAGPPPHSPHYAHQLHSVCILLETANAGVSVRPRTLPRSPTASVDDRQLPVGDDRAWLGRILQARRVTKVLDVSAHDGAAEADLSTPGYHVVTVTPAPWPAGRAGGETPSTLRSPLLDLPPHTVGAFDAVIALGNVLCLVDSREMALAALIALQRCLRPGGFCLVGTRDFDRIWRERLRSASSECVCLDAVEQETWTYEGPRLVRTIPVGDCTDRKRTPVTEVKQEYMLDSRGLISLAGKTGFRHIERIEHPSQVVFLLAGGREY